MGIPFINDESSAAVLSLLPLAFNPDVDKALATFQEHTEPVFKAQTLLNGREGSIAVYLDELSHTDGDNTLVVWFGENRSSDSIFVQHMEVPRFTMSMRGLHQNMVTEQSYDNRVLFGHDKHMDVAHYVAQLFARQLETILGRRLARGKQQ